MTITRLLVVLRHVDQHGKLPDMTVDEQFVIDDLMELDGDEWHLNTLGEMELEELEENELTASVVEAGQS